MSSNATPMPPWTGLSPRATESRRAVFKMLSETLRPPTETTRRNSVSKSTILFNKVNKKSPRPGKVKSSIASLGSTDNSQHTNATSRVSIPPQEQETKAKKSTTKLPPVPTRKSAKSDTTANEGKPFRPTPIKDCHLNNVLRSAKRCLVELRSAKESISKLVAQDEQLSRGLKKTNPTEDYVQLSQVALSITYLCQQAFVPAHRLNQTAIALHSAEDFLRYPTDIRTFDLHASTGRIKLPDMTFNNATTMKLRQVVDSAAETYNKFNGKGRMGEQLAEILFSILRGYQDFYAATLGCQEIFKVLLYTGKEDKAHLQQFLLALSPIDRSDMLVEIQDLRRILDEIVIFLEKLSWGSFVVYRLAGGNGVHTEVPAENPEGGKLPLSSSSIPAYPPYPLLKAKGPKAKAKKPPGSAANLIEIDPQGTKSDAKPSPRESKSGTLKKKKKGLKKRKSIADRYLRIYRDIYKRANANYGKNVAAPTSTGDSHTVVKSQNSEGNTASNTNTNKSAIDTNNN